MGIQPQTTKIDPFFRSLLGIWKMTKRRVYRFVPSRRLLQVDGFSLIRGRWQRKVDYRNVQLDLQRVWTAGRGGGIMWFVMLRGPGFSVSLDRCRSQEKASQSMTEYDAMLQA